MGQRAYQKVIALEGVTDVVYIKQGDSCARCGWVKLHTGTHFPTVLARCALVRSRSVSWLDGARSFPLLRGVWPHLKFPLDL